jgi:putative DNA primase/helicase
MIVGRFLYREAFEFPPTFKPYLITNHQPLIKGDEPAIWRRIRLVPFEVTIPEKQRDPKLKDKLLAELSGILNWALEGCLAWQKSKGLNPPPRVVEATRAYRSEMDWFSDWLAECCDTGNTGTVTSSQQLHASYEQWAKHYGLAPMSRNAFGRRLQERGFERLHTRRGSVFRGIEVRPAAPPTPQTLKQAKSIGAHTISQEDGQEGNLGDDLGDNRSPRAH